MLPLFARARYLAVIAYILLNNITVNAEGNDFLKYEEPKAQVSVLSSIDTILYMLTVFVLILGLAFITSRFVGSKMGSRPAGINGDAVLSSLSLGPNRGVYLVQFGGRLLILGVTEQKIDLLADVTDAPNASQLTAVYKDGMTKAVPPQFSAVFDSHLASLRQIPHKFPRVFGRYDETGLNSDDEPGKR